MSLNFALTPDQLKRAVATVIKNNPVYADILGFYGRLFVAQEESKSRLQIEPLQIPDDVCAVKAREKFPLIEIKDFAYDKVESANFYNEGEKEFRVDLCDSCKKYLKALDSRETERMIYPPLEQISSLHLDSKAKEMGYESGIQLSMQA